MPLFKRYRGRPVKKYSRRGKFYGQSGGRAQLRARKKGIYGRGSTARKAWFARFGFTKARKGARLRKVFATKPKTSMGHR